MGVNAYSKGPVAPAFQSNYISQHTGLPLEYIGAALQAKQEKYDHFLQGVNGLGTEVMGIQGIVPSDAAYVAKAREGYNQQIQELSQQDGTRPEVQRAYQNLVHNLASDKTLNAIRGNYSQLGEKQAQAQKLKADGKYHYSHGQLQTRALQEYEANGGAAGGANLQLEDFTPEVDVMKEYNDIYNVMKPSERDALGMLAAGDEGAIAYKTSHGGIDAQQAFQTARAALETHRNSAGGRQKFLDAKAQGATDDQANAYVAQQLYSRGGAYTFSKSSNDISGALNTRRKEAIDKKAKKEEEDGFEYMNGFSLAGKPQEAEFTSTGEFKHPEGVWEQAKAQYAKSVGMGAGTVQAGTKALGGMLNASGLFGKEAQEYQAKHLNLAPDELEEQYQTEAKIIAKMKAAGKPVPNLGSRTDWMQNVHDPDLTQDYKMPVITNSKAQKAAEDQVVGSGWIFNAALVDPKTHKEVLGRDLIKMEEGKAKNDIRVVSSPRAKWATPFDPHSIMVTIDGKPYIAAGSGLKGKEPQTPEEAQKLNQYYSERAKFDKFGTYPFYRVDKDGNFTREERKQVFNPSYMNKPAIEGIDF